MHRKELKMKKTTTVVILALALVLMPIAASADDAAALFQSKCKSCHGPDGKKLAKADLASATIQGKDDATLITFLTTDAKHKAKVPDQATAKQIVTFLRTLKK